MLTMKKTICILLIPLLSMSGFSQTIDSLSNAKKQELLLKSKNQKTAAYVLVGVGSVAFFAGLAGLTKVEVEEGFGETEGGGGAATALLIGGTVSIGTGAILAIGSRENKKKATQITTGIKWEKTTPLAANNNLPVIYPAMSIQLKL
jgi:hypothetical protein